MQDGSSGKQRETESLEVLRECMVTSIGRRTYGNVDCQTAIPNLMLFRREMPMPPTTCMVQTSIVLVVQGEKQMLVGGEAYPYDINRFLVTSLDIPANSQVVSASKDKPCLGLALKLNPSLMAELITQGGLTLPLQPSGDKGAGIGLGNVNSRLLDPLKRLVDLLDEPRAIPMLAPLIEREIHYRLLQSEQAERLGHIASVGSQGHRVAKAIDWLKLHYSEALSIKELASSVQMSPSSLHQYFRQFTAMSPLQYQKWLRLSEARRLMLNSSLDAASAAFRVGYQSPSQFSREYTRFFGAPPKRDIDSLRRGAEATQA